MPLSTPRLHARCKLSRPSCYWQSVKAFHILYIFGFGFHQIKCNKTDAKWQSIACLFYILQSGNVYRRRHCFPGCRRDIAALIISTPIPHSVLCCRWCYHETIALPSAPICIQVKYKYILCCSNPDGAQMYISLAVTLFTGRCCTEWSRLPNASHNITQHNVRKTDKCVFVSIYLFKRLSLTRNRNPDFYL